MNKADVAKDYLKHLQNGDVDAVIALFTSDGLVQSPIYGLKSASDFYYALNDDTSNSELHLKGIFEQTDSEDIALYFTYNWTLKNGEKVRFDVVDILELDSNLKIQKLTIIYDTVVSRRLVEGLNS